MLSVLVKSSRILIWSSIPHTTRRGRREARVLCAGVAVTTRQCWQWRGSVSAVWQTPTHAHPHTVMLTPVSDEVNRKCKIQGPRPIMSQKIFHPFNYPPLSIKAKKVWKMTRSRPNSSTWHSCVGVNDVCWCWMYLHYIYYLRCAVLCILYRENDWAC